MQHFNLYLTPRSQQCNMLIRKRAFPNSILSLVVGEADKIPETNALRLEVRDLASDSRRCALLPQA